MTSLTSEPADFKDALTEATVPVGVVTPRRPADDAPPRPVGAERHAGGFRGDVAGLRAIAVGLVLLYHAGIVFVPGGFVGVDVFFVISGFLITGQLVSEIGRTGRVSLVGFYARRAKRILPAAAIVLVATAIAAWIWIPATEWRDAGGDIVSAAVYVANWRLADRSVDYLAQDAATVSPVQHYWSLAVEEQFYLVWPLLIVLALLVARWRRRTNVRPVLGLGLLLVAVPSLAWSVYYTAHDPARAFFVSTTRMWELAVGAAVALAATGFTRIPRAAAAVLGWLGLGAIAATGLISTTHTPWPGYAAALPTAGAAAVIIAGFAAGRAGPVALLGTRPFRWVGDLSYSLYLWHWPMLVVATAALGPLSWKKGLAIAALSVVPAWITYKVVENPLRYSKAISRSPRLALSMGGNFTVVGVAAGLALLAALSLGRPHTQPASAAAAGAAALPNPYGALNAIPEQADFLVPDPAIAIYDTPSSTPDCFLSKGTTPIWCTYGNPNGSTRIALVGDSKMDQWLTAFQELAAVNDWRIDISFKAACPFTSALALVGNDPAKPYDDCTAWNRAVLDRLVADRPDYVVTSHGASIAKDPVSGAASIDAMHDGMLASWTRLEAAGTKVIAMANNPNPRLNVDQCILHNRDHLSACSFDPGDHTKDATLVALTGTVAAHPSVSLIDMYPAICATAVSQSCPAVIGNVIVYRSGSHLTSTFVRTLAPWLAAELTKAGLPAHLG